MASAEHRYGECYLAVQVRLVGDQPVRVQAVTAVASRTGSEHVAVTVGRVLFYLQDRAALEALRAAVEQAGEYADAVFGGGAGGVHAGRAPGTGTDRQDRPGATGVAGQTAGRSHQGAARRRGMRCPHPALTIHSATPAEGRIGPLDHPC